MSPKDLERIQETLERHHLKQAEARIAELKADNWNKSKTIARLSKESMQNWFNSPAFPTYCQLKEGVAGKVLWLLQNGQITRSKAAEVLAESFHGADPSDALPEIEYHVLPDDVIPAQAYEELLDARATITTLQAELAALRKATEPQPWPQVKVNICNIEPSAPFICHADRFLKAQGIEELERLLREDPPMQLPVAESIIATVIRVAEDEATGEPEHWEFVNFYEVPMPPAPREEGRG